MTTAALNPLVEKIRAAHPGVYDDMDDATLTKKVLAKYPQYSDLAAPKLQSPVQVESSTSDKILGALAPQQVQRSKTPNTQAGFPGFEGSYSSGDEGKALAMTGAGVATGAALASPAVITALRTAAAAHPFAAEVVKHGLKALGYGAGFHYGNKLAKLSDLLTAGE